MTIEIRIPDELEKYVAVANGLEMLELINLHAEVTALKTRKTVQKYLSAYAKYAPLCTEMAARLAAPEPEEPTDGES